MVIDILNAWGKPRHIPDTQGGQGNYSSALCPAPNPQSNIPPKNPTWAITIRVEEKNITFLI